MQQGICAHCGETKQLYLAYCEYATRPMVMTVVFEERCKQCHRQEFLIMPHKKQNNQLDLMLAE